MLNARYEDSCKQPLTVITGLRICGRMNLDQNMMALPLAWIKFAERGNDASYASPRDHHLRHGLLSHDVHRHSD
jgi:hypothetical protein